MQLFLDANMYRKSLSQQVTFTRNRIAPPLACYMNFSYSETNGRYHTPLIVSVPGVYRARGDHALRFSKPCPPSSLPQFPSPLPQVSSYSINTVLHYLQPYHLSNALHHSPPPRFPMPTANFSFLPQDYAPSLKLIPIISTSCHSPIRRRHSATPAESALLHISGGAEERSHRKSVYPAQDKTLQCNDLSRCGYYCL